MTTTAGGPDAAATAQAIRDHLTILANALAIIRFGGDPDAAQRLAARQMDALARLADALHDPARMIENRAPSRADAAPGADP